MATLWDASDIDKPVRSARCARKRRQHRPGIGPGQKEDTHTGAHRPGIGPGQTKEHSLHRPGVAPPGKRRTRIRVYTVRESSPGSTRKNAEPGLVGMIVGVCRGRVVEGEVGAAAGWWA